MCRPLPSRRFYNRPRWRVGTVTWSWGWGGANLGSQGTGQQLWHECWWWPRGSPEPYICAELGGMEENSSEPHSENWGVWPKQATAWKQPGLKDTPLGAVMGGFPPGNRAQEPQGGEGSEERQVGGTGPRSLALSLTQPRLRFHQLLPEYLIRETGSTPMLCHPRDSPRPRCPDPPWGQCEGGAHATRLP